MPLGWERLNERQQRPNERIVFIKPLEGPDKAIAQDFLNRIAAICVPIMKSNYLSVVSLEEYEPNKEFWGRNFNAGEVIQLILKSPSTGRWLPFKFVQMVMMHELAHCKQMNHSKHFWTVRNEYSAALKLLWSQGYRGDGLWGAGQTLYSGQYAEQDQFLTADDSLVHSCGGVYRTGRGKRRKGGDKPQLTYAERKQKRIERKFGVAGEELGGNELVRSGLEGSKAKPGTKPRVAQSKRGRDLRAAAALARFETNKLPSPARTPSEDDGSETESEFDDDDDEVVIKKEPLDAKGNPILDSKGHGMVKVCEDEDVANDPEARGEMEELGQYSAPSVRPLSKKTSLSTTTAKATSVKATTIKASKPLANGGAARKAITSPKSYLPNPSKDDKSETASETESEPENSAKQHAGSKAATAMPAAPVRQDFSSSITKATELPATKSAVSIRIHPAPAKSTSTLPLPATSTRPQTLAVSPTQAVPPPIAPARMDTNCPICSLENDPAALTCMACSHVLRPDMIAGHWTCKSESCKELLAAYVNAGDNGRCTLCGEVKPGS